MTGHKCLKTVKTKYVRGELLAAPGFSRCYRRPSHNVPLSRPLLKCQKVSHRVCFKLKGCPRYAAQLCSALSFPWADQSSVVQDSSSTNSSPYFSLNLGAAWKHHKAREAFPELGTLPHAHKTEHILLRCTFKVQQHQLYLENTLFLQCIKA